MRDQAERDETTLDIMAALLGAAFLVGVPVVLVMVVVDQVGPGLEPPPPVQSVLPVALLAAYVLLVVRSLRRRGHVRGLRRDPGTSQRTGSS